MLTPTRKKIGKAVARGSKYAIVRECFTDPKTRQFVQFTSMPHQNKNQTF